MITGFYAGLLGLWLVFLLLSVVRLRWKHRVALGDGGEKGLIRGMRIHGNFIETVPFALIIMGLLEAQPSFPPWALHVYGVLLVFSRLAHWHGLRQSAGTSAGRLVGTVIVCLLLAAGSLVLIWLFLTTMVL